MKKITLLLSLILSVVTMYGQCPTEDVLLTTQAEIDNFASTYPNCTQLTHELKIDGDTAIIDNLNGLSAITDAQDIFILKTQVDDFTGLDHLINVRNLTLWFNNNIQNLDGFTALQNAESLEMYINTNLVDLSGLPNIQTIENINFFENNNLNDLSHLSFLTSMNSFVIGGNSISTLTGLENLQTVTGDFLVSNELIENFNELINLQSIGGSLYLMNNLQVLDISAFSNITDLFDLYVLECPNLENLSGLQNIQTIDGLLRIGFNSQLVDLTVFSNITSVNDLDIYQNANLISLRGLENLEAIQNRLFINNNPQLIAIEQLENVDPSLINEVVILNNSILSICNNELTCAIIDDDNVSKTIAQNAPGCNSVEEVLESCLLGADDYNLSNQFGIYPNPVSNILTLNYSNSIEMKNVSVYTLLGQKLFETADNLIDFSDFSNGIYFLNITTDKGSFSKKIIKK